MRVQEHKPVWLPLFLIILSLSLYTVAQDSTVSPDPAQGSSSDSTTETASTGSPSDTPPTSNPAGSDPASPTETSTVSASGNCGKGCLSCSPLDYCLICDSTQLLFLKTSFHPTLPFPHLKTSCEKIDFPYCVKIDFAGTCLFCKVGYFIREGECVEAKLKVGGCLKQIDEDVCRQCLDNYTLASPQSCLVTDPKTDAGEGCKYSRKEKTRCFECDEGYVMGDLGSCMAEVMLAPLVNKGESTLMYPKLTDLSHCQMVSRFECKNCASHGFESDNSKIEREYYLWNMTGAEKYLGQGKEQELDMDNVIGNNTPFVEFGADEILLEKQSKDFIFG